VPNYILLTGSTGLLGRYLLKDLLSNGHRLAVVARPTRRETSAERIESILQMWESQEGRSLPRPVCFEGDVVSEGFGLNDRQQQWIAEHCDTMIHSAAALSFHENGGGEPRRTNLGGTKNAIQLCRQTDIRKLHYVSTAYVCGMRTELVTEDEFDAGQSFRNDYERSKFDAETVVRSAEFLDSLTVYRPAVISGDSVTGYTSTYHGLYLYLRLMALLVPQQELDESGRRYTPIRLPMTGDEKRNIIPVDWVSAAMCRLFMTPQAHGGTYHLVPDKCLTPRQIIDAGYRYFNSTGVEYVGYEEFEPDPSNRFECEFLAGATMYENYETTDPEFDKTNLLKYAGDLPCPEIDEAMLHRYLRFGEEDRWGKRRSSPAEVPLWMGSHLERLVASGGDSNRLSDAAEENALRVGLDLCGPGGGQFTVTLRGASLLAVTRGLSDANNATCTAEVSDFRELLKGQIRDLAGFFQGSTTVHDPAENGNPIQALIGAFDAANMVT
jgi:thioester reductase-like protein